MRRFAVALSSVALLAGLLACGGTVTISGRTGSSASGTVSIVHLIISNGDTQITAVTLLNGGSAQTLNFCGNVVSQFPTNTFVTVTYTQGSGCDTVDTVH